jgi:mono/diheme cytochrome c family protein
MRRVWATAFALSIFIFQTVSPQSFPAFHEKRQLSSDLEVGGALAGAASGSTRYITRDELLAMPRVSFTVRDDANFTGPAKIEGVKLEDLARTLGAASASDMVIAICDDGYHANYPHSYITAHHPVLVLNVNGQPPIGWPKDAHDHAFDMGPYMISHREFSPSFKVLSHVDEAQIPWGVVRLEFRDEKAVFDSIAPRGPLAGNRQVQDGFRIAQQNCFRCHNSGTEGGQKSGRSWKVLSALAEKSPEYFSGYVRNPAAKNPSAQMPGNPQYDDATLQALTTYFKGFSQPAKP